MGNVEVDIDQTRWFNAINAPGGIIADFRDEVMLDCLNALSRNAPVNSPLNRKHRPEDPGRRYMFGFTHDRTGNNRGNGFRIGNREDHAIIVELGRVASSRRQRFSWTGPHTFSDGTPYVPGDVAWWKSTGKRNETNFMKRTVTRVVTANTR